MSKKNVLKEIEWVWGKGSHVERVVKFIAENKKVNDIIYQPEVQRKCHITNQQAYQALDYLSGEGLKFLRKFPHIKFENKIYEISEEDVGAFLKFQTPIKHPRLNGYISDPNREVLVGWVKNERQQ